MSCNLITTSPPWIIVHVWKPRQPPGSHSALLIPLRNSNPLCQIFRACWVIQSDAPKWLQKKKKGKNVSQRHLQTGSEGCYNEGNMEKFQLVCSHTVKTITPLASFLIKNLAWESSFLLFFVPCVVWEVNLLTSLQIEVPCGCHC